MDTIYHVIVEEMHHPRMEVISWSAQLFVVAVAIGAAAVAAYQLKEMSKYRRQRLLIANAQLLMELDNRWDSNDMHASRMIYHATRDEINAKVGVDHPRANDGERKKFIEKAWIDSLGAKRINDPKQYGQLMAICGFFETVGLMVEKEYIKVDDVFKLFMGPIVNIEMCFGGHITELENETGVLAGLYEHARNLSRRAARGA